MNLSTIRILDRLRNIKTKSVLAEHRRWKSIKKGEGHFNTESLDKIRLAAIVPIRLSRNDWSFQKVSFNHFIRAIVISNSDNWLFKQISQTDGKLLSISDSEWFVEPKNKSMWAKKFDARQIRISCGWMDRILCWMLLFAITGTLIFWLMETH